LRAFLKWAESDDYMIYSKDADDLDLLDDMWCAFRAGMRHQRKRAKKSAPKA
jgi:hypothetical protein